MNAIERASDPWLDQFRELFKQGTRVLDLGCGTGDDTVELLKYGARLIAIDRSEERVAIVRARTNEVDVFVWDLLNLRSLDAGTFDVIVASLCLHYFDLETTERIMSDICQLLELDGVLLARVNRVGDNNFDYGNGVELEPEYFELPNGFRKRFFSEESLRGVLEKAFAVELIEPSTTRRWGKEKLTLVAKARRAV